MDPAIPRRFVLQTVGALVAAIALVVLVNYAMDPYGVFGSPRIPGVNAEKTQASGEPRMIKTYVAERVRPNTVLLGASTVDLGFNPDSPLWAPADRPVFNFGIPGSNAKTSLRSLQQVAALHPPRLIVLGLTFDDTVTHAGDPTGPAALMRVSSGDERMRVLPDGHRNARMWRAHVRDDTRMLLSLAALGDSLTTIAQQRDPNSSRTTPHGQLTEGGFRGLVHAEGQAALFAQKNAIRAAKLAGYHGHASYDLSAVAAILDLAHRLPARVIVVIPPSHAQDLELTALAGLLDEYARWRTELTALVAAHAAAGDDATLWDFNSFSAYTMEAVPPPGVKGDHMRWWWETAHFKAELGTLVVARILGHSDVDFGARLGPANAAAATSALIAGEARFRASHPAEAAHLAAIYAKAARAVCKPGGKCEAPDNAE